MLLYLGYGILGASIGYFVSGLVLRFYSKYLFFRYEGIGKSLNNVKSTGNLKECWNMFVIIWHNASRDGLVTFSNYLTSQANTLICSSVLGLTTTGSYGISVQLATIVTGMANIPYTTYQSKMQEKLINNKKSDGLKIFAGSLLLFIAVFFILTLFSVLSIPVIRIFKPTFDLSYLMLFALFTFMFINKLYHLFASYISNSNRIPYTTGFVVSALISVILSYMMAAYTDLGIWALILAPIIVALLYNAWRWPYYVLKDNQISIKGFLSLGVLALKELKLKRKAF